MLHPVFTVKSERVEPGCKFPDNFTGQWVNTGNYNSEVIINSTHIYERSKPDQGPAENIYLVCKESRDSRYMVAKLGVGGWYYKINLFRIYK